jgi:hypothetical protein
MWHEPARRKHASRRGRTHRTHHLSRQDVSRWRAGTKTTAGTLCQPLEKHASYPRRILDLVRTGLQGDKRHGTEWTPHWARLRALPPLASARVPGAQGGDGWTHGGAAGIIRQLFRDAARRTCPYGVRPAPGVPPAVPLSGASRESTAEARPRTDAEWCRVQDRLFGTSGQAPSEPRSEGVGWIWTSGRGLGDSGGSAPDAPFVPRGA